MVRRGTARHPDDGRLTLVARFARRNTIPTDYDYDCRRSGLGWRVVDCLALGGGDRWYVRVHGASAYFGVTLQAMHDVPHEVSHGPHPPDIAGTAGSPQFFWISTGASTTKLKVTIAHGSANLFLRPGLFPTPFANDCAASRRCVIYNPLPSTWFIGVYPLADFSNLKLRVRRWPQ